MATTTLVKDVIYRVSIQLHDATPQFKRWTQRELVAWLNDAMKAIAKYIPTSCARVDAFKLSAGTKQWIGKILAANIKPGDGSTAADAYVMALQGNLRNMGADGATPGRVIRLIDRDELDRSDPNWHTTGPASVVRQYTYDPRTPDVFYVQPPVSGTVWVEGSILVTPAEISSGGDLGMDGGSVVLMPLPSRFDDDVVNYMLARAHLKDAEFSGDTTLVQTHTALFVSSINAQATAITGVNPNLKGLPGAQTVPQRAA